VIKPAGLALQSLGHVEIFYRKAGPGLEATKNP